MYSFVPSRKSLRYQNFVPPANQCGVTRPLITPAPACPNPRPRCCGDSCSCENPDRTVKAIATIKPSRASDLVIGDVCILKFLDLEGDPSSRATCETV